MTINKKNLNNEKKKKVPFNVFSKKGLMALALTGVMVASPLMLAGCSGEQGPAGNDGKNGATWYSGTYYSAEQGTLGDFFYDTDDYNIYQKLEGGWTFISNIKGPQGEEGEKGDKGDKGSDGESAQVSISEDGYWVINNLKTETKAVGTDGNTPYIQDGTWWIGDRNTQIIAQGENGKSAYELSGYTGTIEEWIESLKGKDGASFLLGNIVPTADDGKDGDVYLNVTDYNLYSKADGGWTLVGNIKGADGQDASASEEVMEQAVADYLDQHPELVTVVQNGSLSSDKLTQDLLEILYNNGLQKIEWTIGKRVNTSSTTPANDIYCAISNKVYFNEGDKFEFLESGVAIRYSYFGEDGETYNGDYCNNNAWVKPTTPTKVEFTKAGYYQFSVSYNPTSTTALTEENLATLLEKVSVQSSYILGTQGSSIQDNSIPLSALGEDIYTEILNYDSIYRQAAHGAIHLGKGIVPTADNLGIQVMDTTVCLADMWGHKLATNPSTQTSLGLLIPAGDDLTSTTRSDITVVGDEIWIWGVAPDDHSQYATCLRLKYDPLSNTLRETPKWFWHNFGHCNAVNYNPTTDSLIMGNGGSSYDLENKVYIISNVSEIINSENGAVFDYQEQGIEIDCSDIVYDFGAKLNVFWTNAKATSYNYGLTKEYVPNTAYAYANDVNKFYVLAFGTGTNQYQYGTYVEPTDETGWNGTFTVLGEYDSGDPSEEVSSAVSYEHCGQGGDAIDGVAFVGLGHNPFWWREIKVQNETEVATSDTYLPSFNYETGVLANNKVEGIAVTNQYLIVMASGTIHFIPR